MKLLLLLPLLVAPLLGASIQESLLEMQLSMQQFNQRMQSHQVEIDLFHERFQTLQASIDKLHTELRSSKKEPLSDKRLAQIEKVQDTLIADFQTLKTHLNETNTAIASCQTKLTDIDKHLSSDIKTLKTSLQSMLTLLQKEESSEKKTYQVQPGDSLGHIALLHKTDIKTLKELNHLTQDTIFVGQKLLIP